MHPLQGLLINGVWVFGLAALFATCSYMSWLRRERGWSIRQLACLPVALTPFYLSLTIFCVGLLLTESLLVVDGDWWRPYLLLLFVLYFSIQTILLAQTGRKKGWEKPVAK